jgi:uncharacterized protein YecE (DUF72 family)
LTQTWDDGDDVYVYFNNDRDGAAVRDAARFAAIVRRVDPARTVSRIPESI